MVDDNDGGLGCEKLESNRIARKNDGGLRLSGSWSPLFIHFDELKLNTPDDHQNDDSLSLLLVNSRLGQTSYRQENISEAPNIAKHLEQQVTQSE
jgi:hypothetical protein